MSICFSLWYINVANILSKISQRLKTDFWILNVLSYNVIFCLQKRKQSVQKAEGTQNKVTIDLTLCTVLHAHDRHWQTMIYAKV